MFLFSVEDFQATAYIFLRSSCVLIDSITTMSEGKKEEFSKAMDDMLAARLQPLVLLNLMPDGTNYLAWSRSHLLFIQARGLQVYINEIPNQIVLIFLIGSLRILMLCRG